MLPTKPSSKTNSVEHDELCLRIHNAADVLIECFVPSAASQVNAELEAPVKTTIGPGFVDVLIKLRGLPLLAVEVKSEKDHQAPSNWFRQARLYSEALRVPTLIVVAHDLSQLQVDYLDVVKQPVLYWGKGLVAGAASLLIWSAKVGQSCM